MVKRKYKKRLIDLFTNPNQTICMSLSQNHSKKNVVFKVFPMKKLENPQIINIEVYDHYQAFLKHIQKGWVGFVKYSQ